MKKTTKISKLLKPRVYAIEMTNVVRSYCKYQAKILQLFEITTAPNKEEYGPNQETLKYPQVEADEKISD